jgi:hypothetical protein
MSRFLCRHKFQFIWVNIKNTITCPCLVLQETAKLFCSVFVPFSFSTAMNEDFCCSTSSPVFEVVSVRDFHQSNRCKVVSHHYFNRNSLRHMPLNTFSYAYFLSVYFLTRVGSLGLLPIFNQVVFFLMC